MGEKKVGFFDPVKNVVNKLKEKHTQFQENMEQRRIKEEENLDRQLRIEEKKAKITDKRERLRELKSKNRGSSGVGAVLNNIGNMDIMGTDEKPKKKVIMGRI